MLRIRKHRWGNYLFDIWVISFTVLVFWALHKANHAATESKHVATVTRNLVRENTNRINDIQRARVMSCQRTYEGIREVFKPFTEHLTTPKQRADFKRFNDRIDLLKEHCPVQTHVKKKGRG